MQKSREPIANRIYRALLRVLPFDFRSEFGSEMEAVFQEQRVETSRRSGTVALVKMWWSTILDIFRMAPREHWSVLSTDARYAVRMMTKNPGFTLAAVLILGLGIGANTAIFSVVNSVLFKPLPYADGNSLVVLRQPERKLGTLDAFFSTTEIQDLRQRSKTLTKIVEYHNMTFTLFGKDAAHRVRTGVVSADYFNAFGVRPLRGRFFVNADERDGAEKVLILSYEFWMQAEGGDPNIIGKTYEMNDSNHIVIGVLPPIPQYPDENDVYMPTTSCPMRSNQSMMAGRDQRMMNVFARLSPGGTLQQAQTEMTLIHQQLRKEDPPAYPENADLMITASMLREDLTREARPLLLLLFGAAGFVLLIACANVANLIVARMSRRRQELLIRSAVGAGSGRLLRQLLTESFLLALFAAAVGLVFAYGSLELLTDFVGRLTPRAREISIDGGVLAFAILCASGTTMLFGSVAALHLKQDLSSGLKEGGRTGSETGSNLMRRVFIAAQVAFSCVLLIGAGLMVRSFVKIMGVYPGFSTQKVYAVRTNLNGSKWSSAEQRWALADRILRKMTSIPGVQSAAVSSSFPLDEDNQTPGGRPIRFQVEGDPRPEAELPPVTTARSASPAYFKTLEIALISGRTFLDSDDAKATPVVLLNQALAVKRWGTADPVGKRITIDNGETWMTIVGVVGDVKEFGLNKDTPYQIYRPMAQATFMGSVLVRAYGESVTMPVQLRKALREVEPLMAIVRVETMEQAKAKSVASPRTLTNMFALFAALAMLIAVAGIGSMLALWVRQRVREIGIRMALGASPRDILVSVLRQGMTLTAIGLAAGLLVAAGFTQMLSSLLFRVKPTDALTFLAVSALLLAAALVACYIPARRAAGVDPLVALHQEG